VCGCGARGQSVCPDRLIGASLRPPKRLAGGRVPARTGAALLLPVRGPRHDPAVPAPPVSRPNHHHCAREPSRSATLGPSALYNPTIRLILPWVESVAPCAPFRTWTWHPRQHRVVAGARGVGRGAPRRPKRRPSVRAATVPRQARLARFPGRSRLLPPPLPPPARARASLTSEIASIRAAAPSSSSASPPASLLVPPAHQPFR
jgi:hypothetical protein